MRRMLFRILLHFHFFPHLELVMFPCKIATAMFQLSLFYMPKLLTNFARNSGVARQGLASVTTCDMEIWYGDSNLLCEKRFRKVEYVLEIY